MLALDRCSSQFGPVFRCKSNGSAGKAQEGSSSDLSDCTNRKKKWEEEQVQSDDVG